MTVVSAMRMELARDWRLWLLLSTLVSALAIALVTLNGGASAPAGAAHDAFGRLPLPAKAPISKTLGRDDRSFHASAAAGGFTIANDRQRLAASFGRQGVLMHSGGESFGLSLRSWGYGSSLSDLDAVSPHARANRVSYRHGALEEWWVNGPVGLEQGFTVRSAPAPTRSGPLTLELGLSGSLRPTLERGHDGLALRSKTGDTSLRYTGLTATDARGRSLPARLKLSGGHLRVRVDDAKARYPLTIDPFVQQAKLTAADGEAADELGHSVAISGDTIVAGAIGDDIGGNSSQGSAYVFAKPASGWQDATQTAKLTASDGAAGDQLGRSVAISGDTIVAISAGKRAIYAFVKPSGGWQSATQTAKLTSSDAELLTFEGSPNLAVSGDTIVGLAGIDPQDPPHTGALVFTKPAGGWQDATQQTAKLTASDDEAGDDDNFTSVAVSDDTVVVGAGFEETGTEIKSEGAAYVFAKPAGGWQDSTQNAKLTLSDRQPFDRLGWSVGVSGDTVVASAPFDEQGTAGEFTAHGSVNVYVKPAGGWQDATQTARLTASDAANKNELGRDTVAISGNRIVAGADADFFDSTGPGAAYVFAKPAGGWQDGTQTAKLTASDGATHDLFGQSVGVSGHTIVAGAPLHTVGANSRQGTAYVFGETTTAQVQFLKPLDQSTDPANPVINTGKNGRVVPVKVQLSDNGTPITDQNAPGPVTIGVSHLSSCAGGTSDSSVGTNQLTYDPTIAAWKYNLDTKALGLVTGQCYRIDVSIDGVKVTNAFAVFKPTK
jgi:hypothetical protein